MNKRKKSRRRAPRKKVDEPKRGREPNEVEKLLANGIARGFDLADAALQVIEQDPKRAVNAGISFAEGIGKIGQFVRANPEEAKRVAAGFAVKAMESVSNAVISAGAREMRKKLDKKRREP